VEQTLSWDYSETQALGRGAQRAWATRFRRFGEDDERLPENLKSLHVLAFVCLMLTTNQAISS
jgi:hypothetical protein